MLPNGTPTAHVPCKCSKCAADPTMVKVHTAKQLILRHWNRPAWWSKDDVRIVDDLRWEPAWTFGEKISWLKWVDRCVVSATWDPAGRIEADELLIERIEWRKRRTEGEIDDAFDRLDDDHSAIAAIRARIAPPAARTAGAK